MRNEKIREIIKNLIIGLLLGVPLLVTASIRYDFHYDPGSLQFGKKNGWDFIRVKGLDVTEDVAKPMIPVDYIHLLIPQGQEACSINVTINSSLTIETATEKARSLYVETKNRKASVSPFKTFFM